LLPLPDLVVLLGWFDDTLEGTPVGTPAARVRPPVPPASTLRVGVNTDW
jgi:hypothetical protein